MFLKNFRRAPHWLIGGILGVLYFLITYMIDIGSCQMNSSHCSGATGLITLALNFPAVMILYIIGLGKLWAIVLMDFMLGSIGGFVIGKLIKFFKS